MAEPAHGAEINTSNEPKLVESETKLATEPAALKEESAKETPADAPVSWFFPLLFFLPAVSLMPLYFANNYKTLTEQATAAASTAAATVTSAATGITDNVFSMFGGGAKKEKKEDEDRGDNSGSAKAQKAAAAEENPEV